MHSKAVRYIVWYVRVYASHTQMFFERETFRYKSLSKHNINRLRDLIEILDFVCIKYLKIVYRGYINIIILGENS